MDNNVKIRQFYLSWLRFFCRLFGKSDLDWAGATVTGPAHLQKGQPNQDAFLIDVAPNYWLGVVCDGMGSAQFGGEGAKMATQAVQQAVGHWETENCRDTSLLLKLILNLWKIQMPENQDRKGYNTTCLFALIRKDGSGLMAQLGDGLILWVNDDHCRFLTPDKAFGNQTNALASIRSLDEWKVQIFDQFGPNAALLLATDGVSDDLNEGTEAEFTRYLVDCVRNKWPGKRRAVLEKMLTDWPTPKHADDKTVCVVFN